MANAKVKSLQKLCISSIVSKIQNNQQTLFDMENLRYLHPGILIDVYFQLLQWDNLTDMLAEELSDLEIFKRLLRFNPARQKLLLCMVTLINRGKHVAIKLRQRFIERFMQEPRVVRIMDDYESSSTEEVSEDVHYLAVVQQHQDVFDAINFGLRLGSFLSEAGWLKDSICIFRVIAFYLNSMNREEVKIMLLDCLRRLLRSEIYLYNVRDAMFTYNKFLELFDIPHMPNDFVISCCVHIAEMEFFCHKYETCYRWSLWAVNKLENSTPETIAIDTMRQAAIACVAVGHFDQARFLINHALSRARRKFGKKHQRYADTLMAYAYFVSHADVPRHSISAYKKALDIKSGIFGAQNFHVASAHENLAYAYYENDTTVAGSFVYASFHIDKAFAVLRHFVPEDHMKMSSCMELKALLLIERALEKIYDGLDDEGLFKQAEDIFMFAFKQSLEVFGEMNIKIAKLYDNLGILYEEMTRYTEAELMFQKAITIKIICMFPFDYGVDSSIARLAALYCHKMSKYHEAEALYLRCIEITINLYGSTYANLEHYYLELRYVSHKLRDYEKYDRYINILHNFYSLRRNSVKREKTRPAIVQYCSLEDIKKEFEKIEYPNIDFNIRDI